MGYYSNNQKLGYWGQKSRSTTLIIIASTRCIERASDFEFRTDSRLWMKTTKRKLLTSIPSWRNHNANNFESHGSVKDFCWFQVATTSIKKRVTHPNSRESAFFERTPGHRSSPGSIYENTGLTNRTRIPLSLILEVTGWVSVSFLWSMNFLYFHWRGEEISIQSHFCHFYAYDRTDRIPLWGHEPFRRHRF